MPALSATPTSRRQRLGVPRSSIRPEARVAAFPWDAVTFAHNVGVAVGTTSLETYTSKEAPSGGPRSARSNWPARRSAISEGLPPSMRSGSPTSTRSSRPARARPWLRRGEQSGSAEVREPGYPRCCRPLRFYPQSPRRVPEAASRRRSTPGPRPGAPPSHHPSEANAGAASAWPRAGPVQLPTRVNPWARSGSSGSNRRRSSPRRATPPALRAPRISLRESLRSLDRLRRCPARLPVAHRRQRRLRSQRAS